MFKHTEAAQGKDVGAGGAGVPGQPASGPNVAEEVHVVHAPTQARMGMCSGFILSLLAQLPEKGAVFWISQNYVSSEAGALYGPGLQALGADPARFVLVGATSGREVFWAIEEALKYASICAVVGEFQSKAPLELATTKRLALRSKRAGTPVYLIAAASAHFSSMAQTHWSLAPVERRNDTRLRRRVRSPLWNLELNKNKKGTCREFTAGLDNNFKLTFGPPQEISAAPPKSPEIPSHPARPLEPVVVRLDVERRRILERNWSRR